MANLYAEINSQAKRNHFAYLVDGEHRRRPGI
jgi:hypothetical protein